jgi:hypothetical protein
VDEYTKEHQRKDDWSFDVGGFADNLQFEPSSSIISNQNADVMSVQKTTVNSDVRVNELIK